jgi:uncharacterized protein YvpB
MVRSCRKPARLFNTVVAAMIATSLLLHPHSLQKASAQADAVIIEGIPSVVQWYSLSCEYAAAATITLYWGNLVSQSDFVLEVPQHSNPHKGFRGDIHGPHGWVEDYGIYAEPLVPVLQKRRYTAEAVYGDIERLKAEIDQGYPLVAWITSGRYTPRQEYWETDGERAFKLVPYEHAVVVYGYDSEGVYSMDVGNGNHVHTEWDSFLMRWNYFGGMMLLIHP